MFVAAHVQSIRKTEWNETAPNANKKLQYQNVEHHRRRWQTEFNHMHHIILYTVADSGRNVSWWKMTLLQMFIIQKGEK